MRVGFRRAKRAVARRGASTCACSARPVTSKTALPACRWPQGDSAFLSMVQYGGCLFRPRLIAKSRWPPGRRDEPARERRALRGLPAPETASTAHKLSWIKSIVRAGWTDLVGDWESRVSWLLFIDESGHDHKTLPLEVRGGIAIHVSKLWGFVQGWQRLEREVFGTLLAEYGKEGKGMKLLDKDRFRWAAQTEPMAGDERRKYARSFLNKGLNKAKPTSSEFAAYGQACLEMARGAFELLSTVNARLFASAINRGVKPHKGYTQVDYLRKDHVFLFERFYYFLEAEAQHGIIVMDQSDKHLDTAFVKRMEGYFTRTATGRNRTYWIVPAPLSVSSDITYAVQAADICLYCINWGFRPSTWGDLVTRREIADEFGPKLIRIQWQGDGYRNGRVFHTRGIVHVPDPYGRDPDEHPPAR